MRWKLKLAEYNYKIKYKPGRLNTNADALSRNPTTKGPQLLPLHAKRRREPGGSTPDDQKKLKRTHRPPTRRRITESDGSGNPSPKKQPRIQELSSYQGTEDPAENSPAPSRVVVWSDSEESYYYDTDQSNTVRRVKKRGHGSTSSSDRPIKKRLRKRSERNRKIESERAEVTKPAEQVSSSSSGVPADLSVQPEEHAMTHPPTPPRDSSVYVNAPSSDSFNINMNIETTAEIHAPPAGLDSMHSEPTDEEIFTFKRKRSPDRKATDRKSQEKSRSPDRDNLGDNKETQKKARSPDRIDLDEIRELTPEPMNRLTIRTLGAAAIACCQCRRLAGKTNSMEAERAVTSHPLNQHLEAYINQAQDPQGIRPQVPERRTNEHSVRNVLNNLQ
ncbi:hypothetical protein KM043_007915 [Ampulex compressa]|nr:hypothetical protein KM043_007915 [Ampulex compressa]